MNKINNLHKCLAHGLILPVLLFTGIYISAQTITPGGIDMVTKGYTLDLWVDGNNSTTSSWPNITQANYTLQAIGTMPVPRVQNSKFNFHRELFFGNADRAKLGTSNPYRINAGESYHAFVVSENPGTGEQTLLSFNPTNTVNDARRATLQWNASTIRGNWQTTGASTTNMGSIANSQRFGIASMSVQNNGGAAGSSLYMNGSNATTFQAVLVTNTANRLMVGNGSQDNSTAAAGSRLPFNGAIQEIIVMRGAQIQQDDIQQIHSYLAIKYGLALDNTNDFVNSNGDPVWDRSVTGRNADYHNNIFGIGRDDATGLYQKQSQSANNNEFAIFLGNKIETLNSDNTGTLADMQYLMLGSNGETGYGTYEYAAGTAFLNGSITDEISHRSNVVYKAQLTGASSQQIGIRVIASGIKYILVSSSNTFAPSNTRIYPVVDGIAVNVEINDGDLIAYACRMATPGGINMLNKGYTLDLWIDGNNSTDESWPNISQANYTLQAIGTMPVPTVQNSRFNFHRELFFGNADRTKLGTSTPYLINTGESYHAFVVSENPETGEHTLLSFNPTNSSADARRATLQWNASTIRGNWQSGTSTTNTGSIANTQRFGIASMSVRNNGGAAGSMLYMNGSNATTFQAASVTNTANRLMVGNGSQDNSTAAAGDRLAFNGAIQEIIVMRSAGAQMPPGDLQQIHSYLAIKYGVGLDNTNNLLSSDGNTVWDKSTTGPNAGYHNNIFGIGRDDATGLYQKQSQNVNDRTFAIFVGDKIETLNSDNTGMLADMQYLMLGSNGNTGYGSYDYVAGTPFLNRSITADVNHRSNVAYKAQLTGTSSQQIGIRVTAPDVRYVLVSSSDAFAPNNTRTYSVVNGIAVNVEINDGEFITYACYLTTPGSITNSNYTWRVWLTPDNYFDETGTWANKIIGSNSAGNFVESTVANHAAPDKYTGFNYHQGAFFSKEVNANAFNRLVSNNTMSISRGDNVTAIFVYERGAGDEEEGTDTANDNLFSFNANNSGTLVFRSADNDNLTLYWPAAVRGPATTNGKGIFTVSIANTSTTATARAYANGSMQSFTGNWLAAAGLTNQWTIGANSPSAAVGNGFAGNIQEIIILNAAGTGNHINADDLSKIHTYLAVKYGIHLNNTDNYEIYDTNGTSPLTLWNRDNAFDKNIFGIGRDDASMLNQVQSVSASGSDMTVFLGSLAQLNNQNPAFEANELNDKQFLLFGSDGAAESATNIAVETQFAAGTFIDPLVAPTGLNVVGAKYKAQLTNATAMTVSFEASGFLYCFVSTTPAFDLATTKAYPLHSDGFFHDVEISDTYKYVQFGTMKVGPGGVAIGLKMWLRADDPNSLTLIPNMELANYNVGTSIAWDGLGTPPATHTGVTSWRDTDPLRKTVYNKNNSHASIRTPVYFSSHYLTNYHPAIDFYTDWAGYSAFLSTTKGPMSTGRPANSTTFLIMNSALRSNANNTYMMSFHPVPVLTAYTQYHPALGIQSRNGEGRPRLRMNAALDIAAILFSPGSTTISSYEFKNAAVSPIPANNITVGFNMQYAIHPSSRSVTAWHMNGNGSIGGSRYHTRSMRGLIAEVVMYESALSNDERARINSYYALKYGLTLRPNSSDYSSARFDYKLSNGTILWSGASAASNSPYVRYYNNIAAIIRDDRALLYNRQAHSCETGSIVHVGLAGRALYFNGNASELGEFENDMETVIWGDDHRSGITTVLYPETCGDFDYIFNRSWFFHKVADRPISVLVGLQNNLGNNLGQEPSTNAAATALYGAIHPGNAFVMIVASDPTAFDQNHANYGNFKAVVPMTWLNGEHQCAYSLTEPEIYITFGFKPDWKGCPGNPEVEFMSPKKFPWTQWTPTVNRNSSSALGVILPPSTNPFPPFNLGDDIIVNETKVVYQPGTYSASGTAVRAYRGYPRSVNIPERGSLEIRRRGGQPNNPLSEVITTILFNNPVIPDFYVSGIGANGVSWETVEITGFCEGGSYYPKLAYTSTQNASNYRIVNGNKAVAKRRGNMSATNRNGRVNAEFLGGVTRIEIRYGTTNRRNTSSQNIFISPITLNPVMVPPPVNEDGLAFWMNASPRETLLCKDVSYTFNIQNVNCEDKPANFSFKLPDGMLWNCNSLIIEDKCMEEATFHCDGQELTISNFTILADGITTFRAQAYFDLNAQVGTYSTRAQIEYEKIVHNILTLDTLKSWDYLYGNVSTDITALPTGKRLRSLEKLDLKLDKSCYGPNDTVSVSIMITNPNPQTLNQANLIVVYNEEFKYQLNSLTSSTLTLVDPILFDPEDDDPEPSENWEIEFNIPQGAHILTFNIIAPATLERNYENGTAMVDESGYPVYVPLDVAFEFFSLSEDECEDEAYRDAYRECEIEARPNVYILDDKILCIGETTRLSRWLGGTWTSSNPAVATVEQSETGTIVTAVSGGEVTFLFTLNDSDCVAETEVLTVNEPKISGDNIVCVGETILLSSEVEGSWASSNNSVATISNGVVTGMAVGTVTITFTDKDDCTSTMDITVNARPAAPVIIDAANNRICEGEQITTAFLTGLVSTASGTTLEFYTDAACTIDFTPVTATVPSHTFYVIARNTATGCATASSNALPLTITVNARPAAPVIIDAANNRICEGEQITTAFLTGLVSIDAGTTLEFYTDAACTIDFTPVTATLPSHTFYVIARNTATGCATASSNALVLTVTVNARSAAPVIIDVANNYICESELITTTFLTSLVSTDAGTTLEFYTDAACTIDFAPVTASAPSHTFYVVARNNVTGCATASSNALPLTITVNPCVILDLKLFLQGSTRNGNYTFKGEAKNGTYMTNHIQVPQYLWFENLKLPVDNPYGLPESYSHINDTEGPAYEVVDWILVEIWGNFNESTYTYDLLEERALLLQVDGSVVDVNGKRPTFDIQQGNVRIVVRHRNHLTVASSIELPFTPGIVEYNFSTGIDKAYTLPYSNIPNQMIMKHGVACLWAGSLKMDHVLNAADINLFNNHFYFISGSWEYHRPDLDKNGVVDGADSALILDNFYLRSVYSILRFFTKN